MALRMTEEEYAEWQKRKAAQQRVYVPQETDYGAICGAVPERKAKGTPVTHCAPAAPSGVSAADMAGADVSGIAAAMERKNEQKRQKYGNKRVEVDGIRFDSKHEANIYQQLMYRVRAGELKTVCRQVKFDLPGGIVYIADFVAIRPDMSIEAVYDAKSPATKQNRVYINKKKQMKACCGIEIKEV